MSNPYAALPDSAFWRRSVSGRSARDVDPVVDVPFTIGRSDWVATAGSCFAQHISRTLVEGGFRYLVTEKAPRTDDARDENYGVFPARFANIYTVRQLLQLIQRAYGLLETVDDAWQRADGRWVDPFRPRIQEDGFPSREAVIRDRDVHLAAVRTMIERADVFVFTLGLTEAWVSPRDGAVFPLASGVVSGAEDASVFKNFSVAEMTADLLAAIDLMRRVNSRLRIILTVSPVALIASYERRHVLVSTVASKSALRVVADEVSRTVPAVAYFPSYEIITGPQARSEFFEDDLREVRPEGVEHVMGIFRRHFLADAAPVSATSPVTAPAPAAVLPAKKVLRTDDLAPPPPPRPMGGPAAPAAAVPSTARGRMEALQEVVCDEEALDVPAPRKEPVA